MSQCSTSQEAITAPPVPRLRVEVLPHVQWSNVDPTAFLSVPEALRGGTAGGSPRPEAGGTRGVPDEVPLSIHRQKELGVEPAGTYGEFTSSEFDAGFERRIDRYARAHRRRLDLVKWLRSEVPQVLDDDDPSPVDVDGKRAALARLRECGSYLEFRQYITESGWPIRLHAASFCKQPKLCPFCAIRRATKLLRAYLPKVLTLIEQGYRPHFATFTARNGEDLADRYGLIDRCLRSLMKDGYYGRRGMLRRHAWSSIEAAVFSYEFKRGSGSGLWHPHVHGLIFTRGGELLEDQSQAIREAWCSSTQQSDIRAQDIRGLITLPHDLGPESLSESELSSGVGNDLVEVFKYPLKFSGMSPADTWQAAVTIAGRHLIRPFGALRGVKISDRYADEPLNDKDLPYLHLLLKYDPDQFFYVLRERVFVDSTSEKG